jgi:DNA replication protein DnaC
VAERLPRERFKQVGETFVGHSHTAVAVDLLFKGFHAGIRNVRTAETVAATGEDGNQKSDLLPAATSVHLTRRGVARWITQHADALFLGAPGTGKSHLAQAIGFAVIQQGHRVLYREAHVLLEELADAQLGATRKDYVAAVTSVPLLIVDDLGMRKLPHTAAEDLLEIVMRRYERTSTLITSNRPVEDWAKLLGDTAAVAAMLDRLLHHAHVLTCGPKSWRTRLQGDRAAP